MTSTVARLMATLGLNKVEFGKGVASAKEDLKSLGSSVMQLGTSLKGALGLTVAGLGFQQVISAARSAVSEIAKVGDEAKRAGMSAKAFQEWRFVAEQNRIGVDAMVDGFKELNLRADEFIVTGGGSAAEAFKRLGYNASELEKKLKDPSALMQEIIGRLKDLDKAAQIRVLDELFGGSAGEQFVQLLGQGEDSIRSMIDRAHTAGAVIDESLIAKAQELDRRWIQINQTIGNFFRSFAVGVADAVVQLADFRDSLDIILSDEGRARAVLGNEVYEAISSSVQLTAEQKGLVDDVSSGVAEIVLLSYELGTVMKGAAGGIALVDASLGERLAEISQKMHDLIGQWQAGDVEAEDFRVSLTDIVAEAMDAASKVEAINGIAFSSVISGLSSLGGMLDTIKQKADQARAALPAPSLGQTTGIPISTKHGGWDLLPTDPNTIVTSSPRPRAAPHGIGGIDWGVAPESKKGGSAKVKEVIDSYERQLAKVRENIKTIEAESVALGVAAASGMKYGEAIEYARTRASLLAAAQEAGKPITSELIAEVDQLARAYVTAAQGADQAAEKMRELEENAERGADRIGDIFLAATNGSNAAKKAVGSLILEIARAQMMGAVKGIFGGTSFAGIIGGLIGSNSMGTTSWSGGLTRINEIGGEIIDLPSKTRIYPHDLSKRMIDNAAKSNSDGGQVQIIATHDPGIILQVVDDRMNAKVPTIVKQSVGATRKAMKSTKSFWE